MHSKSKDVFTYTYLDARIDVLNAACACFLLSDVVIFCTVFILHLYSYLLFIINLFVKFGFDYLLLFCQSILATTTFF